MTDMMPAERISTAEVAGTHRVPPATPPSVAATPSAPPAGRLPQAPAHPRLEGDATPDKTTVLSATDEPPPDPPLEDTIRDIVGVLEGIGPSEDSTQSSASPDVSPLPPPLRPSPRDDPFGERQSLVNPEEVSAIVERHRVRLHEQP